MAHRLIFSADHALCKEKIFLLFDALSQLPNFADVIELSKRACAIIAKLSNGILHLKLRYQISVAVRCL